MKHGHVGTALGRNSSLRKATVRDIAKATLIHQRICTTTAKAKESRKLVDKLITLGKKGTLADKRLAFAILCDHGLVSDLFNNTAKRFKDRNGGDTRIILANNRRGDNAQMAYLELTEMTEVIISGTKKVSPAKKEDVKSQKPTKAVAVKEEQQVITPEAEEKAPKKDIVKETPKKIETDKSKLTNKFANLKKMFRRKTD